MDMNIRPNVTHNDQKVTDKRDHPPDRVFPTFKILLYILLMTFAHCKCNQFHLEYDLMGASAHESPNWGFLS